MHRTIINIAFYICLTTAVFLLVYSYYISIILLLLAGVFYIILNPISHSFRDQRRGDNILLGSDFIKESDFLLALELTEPALSYIDCDWDASWFTFLEHRLPNFTVGGRDDIESLSSGAYKTIMIAGKGWKGFSANCIRNLNKFVNEGGRLIFTRPYSGVEIFYEGCDFRYIEDLSELQSIFLNKPVKPRIFAKNRVYTVFFNYGLISMAVRQGVPQGDNRVPKKSKIKIRQRNSFDLCFNDKYAPYPWIDMLDDGVARQLGLPEPKIGKKITVTHDEDYYKSTLVKIVSYETNKHNVQSVNFIMPDSNITRDMLKEIIYLGCEIGIHWNCFKVHLDKTGVHFNPYRSLVEQIEALQKKLPSNYSIISNRTHWLKWSDSYTLPFEIMSGAEIKIDATFGAWLHHQGPLFGTMRPYRVINSMGLPLPIHEIPTLAYDNIQWIIDHQYSDVFNHQCWLNILFHPKPTISNMQQSDSSWYTELSKLKSLGFKFTTFSEGIKRWKN